VTASHKDIIRDEFCNLTIQERAALGEQIGQVAGLVAQDQDSSPLSYGAVRFNRPPREGLWSSSRDVKCLQEKPHSSNGADNRGMFHYGKEVGVTLVANQVGADVSFLVFAVRNVRSTAGNGLAGDEYFGNVRPRRVEQSENSDG